MRKFTNVNELVNTLKPDYPVYCIRPDSIKTSTQFFKKKFPGKVLYAVKTNPNQEVLRHIIDNGIKNFDTASIKEIQLIRELKPDAHIYFMHTVKSRNDVSEAYFNLGIKDFALDTKDELIKILESTNYAKDLTLYVRISISNEHAEIDLSRKFGAQANEALGLVRLCKEHASKIGISFHVGSQCMQKISFTKAIREVGNIIKKTKIIPDIINVGGGFPSIYPDLNPEPLDSYLNEIKESIISLNLPFTPELICEPGRALVAESGSTIVKVNLRKKNKLYINDGTYGTLFDAGVPNFILPSKIILNGRIQSKKLTAFKYGLYERTFLVT
jgi:ornithine decarboxylase